MSKILDNIYVWVVLVNMESVLLLALVKYMLCSHFTQNFILLFFFKAKNRYFVTKNCWKSSYICVSILSKKRHNWFHKNLHNSGMVGCGKLPDPSLNSIFNALSIGVQYTLSFRWTNFGLKCLLEKLFQNRQSWHPFLIRCKLMKTYADVFLCCKLEKADFYKIVLLKTFK